MKPKQIDFVGLLLIGAALWLALGGGGLPFTVPGLSKPTDAVYVYEKNSGGVPPAVTSGLSKLNEQGIMATTHEVDTKDATEQIPDQYKHAVPAAKSAGLPALVVSAGEKVLRTVKAPTTEEAVLEAAR